MLCIFEAFEHTILRKLQGNILKSSNKQTQRNNIQTKNKTSDYWLRVTKWQGWILIARSTKIWRLQERKQNWWLTLPNPAPGIYTFCYMRGINFVSEFHISLSLAFFRGYNSMLSRFPRSSAFGNISFKEKSESTSCWSCKSASLHL